MLRRIELRATTSWAVAALIGSVLLRYFWIDEGALANVVFTAGITLALIACLVLQAAAALLVLVRPQRSHTTPDR